MEATQGQREGTTSIDLVAAGATEVIEAIDALVEADVPRARLAKATSVVESTVSIIESRRDALLAQIAGLEEFVAQVQSQLERKAKECEQALDDTLAAVTTTFDTLAKLADTRIRTLESGMKVDHEKHYERIDAALHEQTHLPEGELEKKADQWSESLNRTMASIARRLDSKVARATEIMMRTGLSGEGEAGHNASRSGDEAESADQTAPDDDEEKREELDKRVVLNVGGRTFETFRSTLQKYPGTLLGAMFGERNKGLLRHSGEYFFDRNGDLFAPILDFYRLGELVKPASIDAGVWAQELDYWNIPNEQAPSHRDTNTDTDAIKGTSELLNKKSWAAVQKHGLLIETAVKHIAEHLDSVGQARLEDGSMVSLAGKGARAGVSVVIFFRPNGSHEPLVIKGFLEALTGMDRVERACVLAELVRRLATEKGINIKFYVTCDILSGRKMVIRDTPRGSPWYIYAKAYFYPNHQITADLQSNTFMQENVKAHVQNS